MLLLEAVQHHQRTHNPATKLHDKWQRVTMRRTALHYSTYITIKLSVYQMLSQTLLQCRKPGVVKLLKTNRDLSFWSICKTAFSSTLFKYFSDWSSEMACINKRQTLSSTAKRRAVAKCHHGQVLSQMMIYLISLDSMFCFLSLTFHKLHNEAFPVSVGHCQPVNEYEPVRSNALM